MKCRFWFPPYFFFACILLAGLAPMQAAVFVINSSQSQISLSGKIDGKTMAVQGSGSLTTSYFGLVNAVFVGTNLQFTGGGAVIAMTNGNWKPTIGATDNTATDPADYGAQASFLGLPGYGAGRGIVLDITSPPLPIQFTNFDSSGLSISLPTNGTAVFDFYDPLQNGTQVLVGTSTNAVADSSIITNNNVIQLSIRIDTIISGTNSTLLHLIGKLVATNSLSVLSPPVIAGFARTNNNFVLTVSNGLPQCQLQSSTNLLVWTPATATSNVVGGLTVFTVTGAPARAFFRVQK